MNNKRKKRRRMKWIWILPAAMLILAQILYASDFLFPLSGKDDKFSAVWLIVSMIVSMIAVAYFLKKYGKKE